MGDSKAKATRRERDPELGTLRCDQHGSSVRAAIADTNFSCDDCAGMAAYHVFVDGPVDGSAEGSERLAAAIAEHYGLPIAELRNRLASGRFRVKGNADRPTADTYVHDLEQLGARCSIETASESNAAKTPLPFPAIKPVAPAIARTTSGSKTFQSGLSAAFSGEQQLDGLGALDEDGTVFQLGSVDGTDGGTNGQPPPPVAFASPVAHAGSAGGAGRAGAAGPRTSPAPAQAPIDMFAPPDAEEANVEVNLAPEEQDRAARKRAQTPLANEVVAPPVEAGGPASRPSRPSRPSLPSLPSLHVRPAVEGPRPSGLADPKIRFAAGVIIAILVGFIPAHLVASMRERSAYAEIDAKVNEVQQQAETPETYAALDGFRAVQLEHKHEDRRNAALLAMLVWAAAGAGIAFVWFKKIAPPSS
jgi:hypothetical protein